jgi:hypothetical protein
MNYALRKFLLRLINYLNDNPGEYAFIDNMSFYSKLFLKSGEQTQTLEEFFKDMEKMEKCMNSGENCLILGGIVYKGADLSQHLDGEMEI